MGVHVSRTLLTTALTDRKIVQKLNWSDIYNFDMATF